MVNILILFVCSIQLLLVHSVITELECIPYDDGLRMQWETLSGEKRHFDFSKRSQSISITNTHGEVLYYRYRPNMHTGGYWALDGAYAMSDKMKYCNGAYSMPDVIKAALSDGSVVAIGSTEVKGYTGTTIPKSATKIKTKTKSRVKTTKKTVSIDEGLGGVTFTFTDDHGIFHDHERQDTVTIGANTYNFIQASGTWMNENTVTREAAAIPTDRLREIIMRNLVTGKSEIQIGPYTLQNVEHHHILSKSSSKLKKGLKSRAKKPPPLVKAHRGRRVIKTQAECKLFSESTASELKNICETKCAIKPLSRYMDAFAKEQCTRFGRALDTALDCTEPTKPETKRVQAICNEVKEVSRGKRSPMERPCVANDGRETEQCKTDCIDSTATAPAPDVCMSRYGRPSSNKDACQFQNEATDARRDIGYYWTCEPVKYCKTYENRNNQCDATGADKQEYCRKDLTLETKGSIHCNEFKWWNKFEGKLVDRIHADNNKKICAINSWREVDGKYKFVGESYFIVCSNPGGTAYISKMRAERRERRKKAKKTTEKEKKQSMAFSPYSGLNNYQYKPFVVIVLILFILFGIFCFFIGGGVTLCGFGFGYAIYECRNQSKVHWLKL